MIFTIITHLVVLMIGVLIGVFAMCLVSGRAYQKGRDDLISEMNTAQKEMTRS